MNLQHIDLNAGEDRTLVLYARDTSNNPKVLTSHTLTWLAGRPPFDPTNDIAVITKSGTISNASAGIYTVSITPSDTLTRSGNYVHMGFIVDTGDFINNSGGILQFQNDQGGDLDFFEDGTEVITAGRFTIRKSVGN